MWRLSPPNLVASDVFDAVSAKRKTLAVRMQLAALSPAVRTTYASYVTAAAADTDLLTMLQPATWTDREGDALRANYDLLVRSTSAPIASLYDRLRLATRFCPMCGERTATELDHYLPQAVFPEFSLLPMNLVPVCPPCNKTKSSQYKTATDEAVFLHAYLDDLAGEQCVQASVDTSTRVPILTYSVRCPGKVPAADAARIERHFERLELAEFFSQLANRQAMGVGRRVLLERAANVPVGAIQSSLRTQARLDEPEFGINSWRIVMLRALAEDQAFCSGVCTGVNP